jgi:CRISPR system Cascade subunit CasD
MSRFLCFWLQGPLCSWGDIAVGEVRPSQGHPTKSAVLGLLAGALGVDRFDQAAHDALHQGLSLAVLVVAPGQPLRDFHTVEPPRHRRGVGYATRREEVLALTPGDSPIVSERHYYCDARYAVGLRRRRTEGCPSLERIARALEQPVYVPYLGRKSCPPGLPFSPRLIAARDVARALVRYLKLMGEVFRKAGLAVPLPAPDRPLDLLADEDDALLAPAPGDQVFHRRDTHPQRTRWQFGLRRERRRALVWSEA